MSLPSFVPSVLLIGASRGIGLAMAEQFLAKGWHVTGTVRSEQTPLHALADAWPGQLQIEILDMCDDLQLAALDARLNGSQFDMLFVNAGTTNRDPSQTIGEITTEEFIQVMTTNALAPHARAGKAGKTYAFPRPAGCDVFRAGQYYQQY